MIGLTLLVDAALACQCFPVPPEGDVQATEFLSAERSLGDADLVVVARFGLPAARPLQELLAHPIPTGMEPGSGWQVLDPVVVRGPASEVVTALSRPRRSCDCEPGERPWAMPVVLWRTGGSWSWLPLRPQCVGLPTESWPQFLASLRSCSEGNLAPRVRLFPVDPAPAHAPDPGKGGLESPNGR